MKTSSVVLSAVIAATALLAAGFYYFNVSNSTRPIPIRGLESVELDGWTRGLSGKVGGTFDPSGVAERVERDFEEFSRAATESEGARIFFESVRGRFARAYPNYADYRGLAESLERGRERIRTREPKNRARVATLLLTLMEEETLAVASRKFRDPSSIWIVPGPAADRSCPLGEPGKDYVGLRLCAGDTLISKGVEFSSALNLFRMPLAAAYSHSALVVPDSKGALRLLEAEGFGGSFSRITEDDTPFRASVYRIRRERDPKGDALRGALREAGKIVRGKDEAPDNSVFAFNFGLNPECRKGAYYCSEMNYCLFHDAGIDDDRNPFPKTVWSKPTEQNGKFIDQVWPVFGGELPNPSDIELNPGYELVGHRVELAEIPRLRVQFAALNALMTLLDRDPAIRDAYLVALKGVGEGTLGTAKPDEIQRVMKLGSLRPSEWAQMKAVLPGELLLREIVFYYHVQHRLLPEVESILLQADSREGGPIPLGELGAIAMPEIGARIEGFNRRAREVRGTL